MTDRRDRIRPDDGDYVNCSAGATTALGNDGQVGDYIKHIVVRNSPGGVLGALSIKDGSDAAKILFNGTITGAGFNSEVRPFTIPVGARSRTGGWSVVIGAGAAYEATAVGRFSGGV